MHSRGRSEKATPPRPPSAAIYTAHSAPAAALAAVKRCRVTPADPAARFPEKRPPGTKRAVTSAAGPCRRNRSWRRPYAAAARPPVRAESRPWARRPTVYATASPATAAAVTTRISTGRCPGAVVAATLAVAMTSASAGMIGSSPSTATARATTR